MQRPAVFKGQRLADKKAGQQSHLPGLLLQKPVPQASWGFWETDDGQHLPRVSQMEGAQESQGIQQH